MPTKTNNRKGDGYKLFAGMLRALHRQWIEPVPDSIPDNRLGLLWRKADTSTLRRYLERAANSPRKVREGFYVAMNDYIGGSQESVAFPEFYQKAARQ